MLILTSARTLQKITMNLNRRTGIDDSEYFCMRYSKLNVFDINILLMINKIYTSKCLESTGGQVFGLTEDREIAAIALCFMIKSLVSEYRDMAGIFPIPNLWAKTEKKCFEWIMALVHSVGFNITDFNISVNNASAYRKFLKNFFAMEV